MPEGQRNLCRTDGQKLLSLTLSTREPSLAQAWLQSDFHP